MFVLYMTRSLQVGKGFEPGCSSRDSVKVWRKSVAAAERYKSKRNGTGQASGRLEVVSTTTRVTEHAYIGSGNSIEVLEPQYDG